MSRHRALRLQWAREYCYWALEQWKELPGPMNPKFLHHVDIRIIIRHFPDERLGNQCTMVKTQADSGSIMMWCPRTNNCRNPKFKFCGFLTFVRRICFPKRRLNFPTRQRPLSRSENCMQLVSRAWVWVKRTAWLPNSPDFSPIEHTWDTTGRLLRA